MLTEILWPAKANVIIDQIEVVGDKLVVIAQGTQEAAHCPNCHTQSARINSHYDRHPADLPCTGYAIQLVLTVPRFFCDNDQCPQRTFAARFPELLEPYARRTKRLVNQQQQVGFNVSAEAGAQLLQVLGMLTSPDTLIRMVRQNPEAQIETPRVLGVDDWAYRKGDSYGTILVDLEKHEVIDLLEDRSAETLIKWLEEHPGVEIISRDRGQDYIEGATQGAPEAIQIADRFHLFQNIVDTLKRMLEKKTAQLRQATHQVAADEQAELEQAAPEPSSETDKKPQESSSMREARFAEVKTLQKQRLSRRAIAKQLNMDRRTVGKYFDLDKCPQRPPVPQSTSSVTPYLAYLSQRWEERCHNIKQLHDELKQQDFDGHYMSVYRAVQRLRQTGQIAETSVPPSLSVPFLSATQAAWILIHPDERLDDTQLKVRDKLCELSDEIKTARQLAQDFCQLLRERQADKLDSWLQEARLSGIKAFKNFAASLGRDYTAVKAAMTYEWNNGQVEGQVNRLKFIKRQMYGRAKFDLLRRRVLGAPAPG